ncbi:MAG: gamma-glutamyltransferase family protein [Halobacteriaceae archaeon]
MDAADFSYPMAVDSRRSPVMARRGMVATSHPLAARTGLRVLEDGGNAADAAVATAAVLNVVEPGMTGIGGDCFVLSAFDGEYAGYNGSGGAPAAADLAEYQERTPAAADGQPVMPQSGGLPVTVPGALDAWAALLERYGTRGLDDLLAPAVRYAREGVPVPPHVADWWADAAPRLARFPESRSVYLPDGRAPGPGETFANPALADTLAGIAETGPGYLYDGPLGAELVEVVRRHGGTLAVEDLRAHEGEWTEPVSTTFGGYEVLEHPPNGQGVVALAALNVARQFDLPADPTDPDRLHHLIEAVKLAFADGYAHVTDPDRYAVPTAAMCDPAYGAERAAEVGHRAAEYGAAAGEWAGGAGPAGEDTAYLAVVDGDGNAVSLINSVYMPFGSGLVAGGAAIQNRGHSFSLDADHANALEPGKRPYHTIIPALLRDADSGALRAAWGVMGGSMQPQGHLQVLAALADGANPQAALDAPRFRWLEGRRVAVETDRVSEGVLTALRSRGHRVVDGDEHFFGGGQVVYTDGERLIGGSDPRKDGHAAGF